MDFLRSGPRIRRAYTDFRQPSNLSGMIVYKLRLAEWLDGPTLDPTVD
jgi:hypothetical protein